MRVRRQLLLSFSVEGDPLPPLPLRGGAKISLGLADNWNLHAHSSIFLKHRIHCSETDMDIGMYAHTSSCGGHRQTWAVYLVLSSFHQGLSSKIGCMLDACVILLPVQHSTFINIHQNVAA